jgi:hypothetical protein
MHRKGENRLARGAPRRYTPNPPVETPPAADEQGVFEGCVHVVRGSGCRPRSVPWTRMQPE